MMAEAAALRAEVKRRRDEHTAQVIALAAAGGTGNRFAPSPELLKSERQLAEIGMKAEEAAASITGAEYGYNEADQRVTSLTVERDVAAWFATTEAGEGVFEEMRRGIAAVLSAEARLRGLVCVLRKIGLSNDRHGTVAFRVAELVENRIEAIRQTTVSRQDGGRARALIGRLRIDPRAMLGG